MLNLCHRIFGCLARLGEVHFLEGIHVNNLESVDVVWVACILIPIGLLAREWFHYKLTIDGRSVNEDVSVRRGTGKGRLWHPVGRFRTPFYLNVSWVGTCFLRQHFCGVPVFSLRCPDDWWLSWLPGRLSLFRPCQSLSWRCLMRFSQSL